LQEPLRKTKSPHSIKANSHSPHFNNEMHRSFKLMSALKLPTHFLQLIPFLSTVARSCALVQKKLTSSARDFGSLANFN